MAIPSQQYASSPHRQGGTTYHGAWLRRNLHRGSTKWIFLRIVELTKRWSLIANKWRFPPLQTLRCSGWRNGKPFKPSLNLLIHIDRPSMARLIYLRSSKVTSRRAIPAGDNQLPTDLHRSLTQTSLLTQGVGVLSPHLWKWTRYVQ